MRACIIFNPTARGAKARRLLERLHGPSFDCALKPTYAKDSGRALAREAVEEGFDTIIAAGGDGTVNEVINGLADADGFEKARLGVLPVGTANVFARQLRLPLEWGAAWNVLQAGRERAIDLPVAEYQVDEVAQRRHFIQLAGAGLDSRAIALVEWESKKQLGFASYVWAGMKALSEPQARIHAVLDEMEASGELVLIGNGNYYGGQFNLFPRANLADGKLDVLVFPRVRWLTFLELGWGWMTDQLHRAGGALSFQTPRLTLRGDPAVWFELDGDNVGPLPVTFSIMPGKLRVIAGAA